jgi:hypothetical protein
MKRILLLLLLCACFTANYAQEHIPQEPKRDSLPYRLYPNLPAFNIRTMDSFNVFNTFNIPKGRHALLILFSPDCKHCHDVAIELLKGMDSLSNIDFYWVTPEASMTKVRGFYKDLKMDNYKNIKIMGRDYEFFYIDFYGVNSYPDFALYDENKMFVHLFQGRVIVGDLYGYTHKSR